MTHIKIAKITKSQEKRAYNNCGRDSMIILVMETLLLLWSLEKIKGCNKNLKRRKNKRSAYRLHFGQEAVAK